MQVTVNEVMIYVATPYKIRSTNQPNELHKKPKIMSSNSHMERDKIQYMGKKSPQERD